jgi:hypothetical protein
MKICFLALLLAVATTANAQDKPRVFVQGKGSENVSSNGSAGGGKHWGTWGAKSTVDAHDESMEVTKDLQKNCPAVSVTINQANADYVIMMNRESKQNRGLLRSNSQIQVANKMGDVLGTNATRTVQNASKDACSLMLADWQTHGRLNAGQPATTAVTPDPIPAPQPATVQPAVQTTVAVQTAPAAEVVPAVATAIQPQPAVVAAVPTSSGDSVADAAKKEKQRKACLALAQDNPTIICK